MDTMTKDEFITSYGERSGIGRYRTEYGYNINGWKRYAVPCNCGDPVCQGWAMISIDDLPHNQGLKV